jgi:hypothetical protein
MSLKDPCVKGLAPKPMALLGGGGTFGRWSLERRMLGYIGFLHVLKWILGLQSLPVSFFHFLATMR